MKKNAPIGPDALLALSQRSYEGFTTASTDLNAALRDSPYVSNYTYYHPQHTGLMNAYNAWTGELAIQKGLTVTLTDLLDKLPAAAYDWAYAIEGVYKKGSAEYVTLLPKGRTIFSTGKQVTRINAIAQLSTALTGITALATVKTSVDNYLTSINAANTAQKSSKNAVAAKKKQLEDEITNAVQSMIYVLGDLTKEFNNDLSSLDEFFPPEIFRKPQQKLFTGTLPPESFKLVATRTLKVGALVTLKNTGRTSTVSSYLAETKFGEIPVGVTPITVKPGYSVKVPVEDLGNLANRYLIVSNPSLGEASWELQIQ